MNWSKWIRQVHRWLSIIFTLAVLCNFAVMGRGDIALWVDFLTLLPLALLLFTGLYMFALPYANKGHNRRLREEEGA
jgi:hypothetical protein